MDSSVSRKDQIWFLRVCHHVSNVLYVIYKPRLTVSAIRPSLSIDSTATGNHETPQYAKQGQLYTCSCIPWAYAACQSASLSTGRMYTFTKTKVIWGPESIFLHVGPCTLHHGQGVDGGDHPPPFWRSYWFGWVRHPLPFSVRLGLASPRPVKDDGVLTGFESLLD